MADESSRSARPIAAWIAILAIGSQAAMTLPRIYGYTIGCWLRGSRDGGFEIGIHDDWYSPTLVLSLINLVALPSSAALLLRPREAPSGGRRSFDKVLGILALVVLMLAIVPGSVWKRTTWLLAGPGPGGVYEMMDAAEECDVERFEALRNMGVGARTASERALLSSGSRRMRDTPLVLASRAGCVQSVEGLLALGVSTEEIHVWGYETALFAAVRNRRLDVARRLVGAGAEVHGRNEAGQDLLTVARGSRDEETVAYVERLLRR